MPRSACVFVILALLAAFAPGPVYADRAESTAASEIPPISSALHLLRPIGSENQKLPPTDQTLTAYLLVEICRVEGEECELAYAFTSRPSERGLDYIKLEGDLHHLNWGLAKSDVGETFELHFIVAGLEIGTATYTPATGRSLPVRFSIDNHPRIRARVLHEQGATAAEIAQVLIDEFALEQDDVLAILVEEGFSAYDLYRVLVDVYLMSTIEAERVLYSLGYSPDEYLEFTALETVARFAPVLAFDDNYHGLPMSAQVYFQTVLKVRTNVPATGWIAWTADWEPACGPGMVSLCGRDECTCGMENTSWAPLRAGEVPTYFKVVSDIEERDQGRLRITYWWFYGFQHPCSWTEGCPGPDGAHHGDWENIVITTSPDREQVDYVNYFFHGYWYTRARGGFDLWGERPVSYVGRLAHGNYHNTANGGWMYGTPHHCCEYADSRNSNANTLWTNIADNLVSLRSNSEPWMLSDPTNATYELGGITYTIADWDWGPHVSYCDWWLFGCMDWKHNYASGTHPTNVTYDWSLRSCNSTGCGVGDCRGLDYPEDAYFNQPWLWP